MLDDYNPLKLGALLATLLICCFNCRYLVLAINYYRIFTEYDVDNKTEAKVLRHDYSYFDVKEDELNDYNYPYTDIVNYTYYYDDVTTAVELPSVDVVYIFVKQNLYLTTTYWIFGFVSVPFLLFGIYGGSDTCILIWLYLMALKICCTFKLLISLSAYVNEVDVFFEFVWPYADFPFVVFLVSLWFVVFFYFLEVQRSFFISPYLTRSSTVYAGSSQVETSPPTPTISLQMM